MMRSHFESIADYARNITIFSEYFFIKFFLLQHRSNYINFIWQFIEIVICCGLINWEGTNKTGGCTTIEILKRGHTWSSWKMKPGYIFASDLNSTLLKLLIGLKILLAWTIKCFLLAWIISLSVSITVILYYCTIYCTTVYNNPRWYTRHVLYIPRSLIYTDYVVCTAF